MEEITPEVDNARFIRPAAFAAGAQDVALMINDDWQTEFEKAFDDLRFVEIIDNAGHWVQMEQPEKTTAAILRFLGSLDLS